MNTKEYEELIDIRLSNTILLSFVMLIANHTFKEVFNINDETQRQIVSLVFFLVVGFYYLLNMKILFKRNLIKMISFYLIAVFIIGFSILFNSKIIVYVPEMLFYLLFLCLPIMLFYISIIDKNIFYKMLLKSRYVQFSIGLLYFLSIEKEMLQYDMIYSYLMLLPLLLFVNNIFKKFNIIDLFLFAISLFIILSVGSRGPLFSLLIYIIAKVFLTKWGLKSSVYQIMFKLIILASIIAITIFFNSIILVFVDILNYFGFGSRSLQLLIGSDNIDFFTGRIEIYNIIIGEIKENPFLGLGLLSDRVILNGTYAHNFFLEIFIHFGLIIGLFISLLVVYKFIYKIYTGSNSEVELSLLFLSVGFSSLLFSGSYLTNYRFWLFLAIIFSIKEAVKNEKIS